MGRAILSLRVSLGHLVLLSPQLGHLDPKDRQRSLLVESKAVMLSICDQMWHARMAPFLQAQVSRMVTIHRRKLVTLECAKTLCVCKPAFLGTGLLHTFPAGSFRPTTSSLSQQPSEVSREGIIISLLETRGPGLCQGQRLS